MAQQMSRQLMDERLGNMADLCEKLWSEPAEGTRLEWRARMANYRLFCVCEGRDNLLLWAHYADSHKGVAFELDGAAETGMPLCVAERVHYSNRAPALHTRKEWIEVGLGLRPFASGQDVWRKLVTTKSKAWAYEQEWRIVSARRPGETEDFVDLPFPAENSRGIFLGCRIPPEDKDAILQLAGGSFAAVPIYQAKQSERRFALEFERIRYPGQRNQAGQIRTRTLKRKL
jgi:hypothetical protein